MRRRHLVLVTIGLLCLGACTNDPLTGDCVFPPCDYTVSFTLNLHDLL